MNRRASVQDIVQVYQCPLGAAKQGRITTIASEQHWPGTVRWRVIPPSCPRLVRSVVQVGMESMKGKGGFLFPTHASYIGAMSRCIGLVARLLSSPVSAFLCVLPGGTTAGFGPCRPLFLASLRCRQMVRCAVQDLGTDAATGRLCALALGKVRGSQSVAAREGLMSMVHVSPS